MRFVCLLEALDGKTKEFACRLSGIARKHKEKQVLGLFGKPDAVIIFEAESEEKATEFVLEFSGVARSETLLAVDPRKLKHRT
ncbi:MAG: hypothetical protein AABX40_04380 [Candidatus Hydrothermarchaeota archaeon]